MRSYLFVALLATAALFASSDARQLAQDALSNSNGCLDTIPKCEQGACATRNIMGVARWVCLRCLANYEPVVDASGQDNILQCGEWGSGGDSLAACTPLQHLLPVLVSVLQCTASSHRCCDP